ncbi:hypothetical protein Aduo_006252 [Ancylostoma duodenale]
MDVPPPPKRRRLTRTGSALTAMMPAEPPAPRSAPSLLNPNVDERMMVRSPVRAVPPSPLPAFDASVVNESAQDPEPDQQIDASQESHLHSITHEQKISYLCSFASHFGVSQTMLTYLDDLCEVVAEHRQLSVSTFI